MFRVRNGQNEGTENWLGLCRLFWPQFQSRAHWQAKQRYRIGERKISYVSQWVPKTDAKLRHHIYKAKNRKKMMHNMVKTVSFTFVQILEKTII